MGGTVNAINTTVLILYIVLFAVSVYYIRTYWGLRKNYYIRFRFPTLAIWNFVSSFSTNLLTFLQDNTNGFYSPDPVCFSQFTFLFGRTSNTLVICLRFLLLILSFQFTQGLAYGGFYRIHCFKISEHRISRLLSTKQYMFVVLVIFLSLLHLLFVFPFYLRALRNPDNITCGDIATGYLNQFFLGMLFEILYLGYLFVKTSKVKEELGIKTELIGNIVLVLYGFLMGVVSVRLLDSSLDRNAVSLFLFSVYYTLPVLFLTINIIIPLRHIKNQDKEIENRTKTNAMSHSSPGATSRYNRRLMDVMDNQECKTLFREFLANRFALESFNFIESVKALEDDIELDLLPYDSLSDRLSHIYNTFINENTSTQWINLSNRVQSNLDKKFSRKEISNMNSDIFHEAVVEISKLLYSDCVLSFKMTDEYNKWKESSNRI